MKETIRRQAISGRALLQIKLQDGSKHKGYLDSTGEEEFVLADSKTGAKTAFAYREVTQVKQKNLSRGRGIWLGVGLTLGVAALLEAIFVRNS